MRQVLLFLFLQGLIFWPGQGDLFVSKNLWESCTSQDSGLCTIYLFIRIIILLISEFLPLELTDGFQLESDWQQVASSHQDSS